MSPLNVSIVLSSDTDGDIDKIWGLAVIPKLLGFTLQSESLDLLKAVAIMRQYPGCGSGLSHQEHRRIYRGNDILSLFCVVVPEIINFFAYQLIVI